MSATTGERTPLLQTLLHTIRRLRAEDRGDAVSSMVFALAVVILGTIAITAILAGLASTTAASKTNAMNEAVDARVAAYVSSVRAGAPSTAALCYTGYNWCVSVGSSTVDGAKRNVTVTAEVGTNTSTAVTQSRTVNTQAGNLITGYDAAGNPVWGTKNRQVHLAVSQQNLGTVACSLDSSGDAFCWGPDLTGERGDGFNQTSLYPTSVAGAHSFTSISAGTTVTCGIDQTKAAWCWGADDAGQRGDASTSASYIPTAVAGNHQFATITAGDKNVCGLDTAGAAWCWGDNTNGQDGDGTTNTTATPVAVAGSHTFSTVAVDGQNACGLDTAGAAWCWGDNTDGQDGDGTTTTRQTPVAVTGSHTFTQLTMRAGTVCAVDSFHAAWCWGDNTNGRTGTGSAAGHVATPTALSGSLLTASLYPGADGTWCLLDTQHKAYCWGVNSSGQVGDGTTTDRSAPTYVAYGGHIFTQLALADGTTCGIDLNNLPLCWGDNTTGGLGNGSSVTGNPNPGAVVDGHLFTQILAHGTTICGIDTTQRPWCWGGTTYRSSEKSRPSEVLESAPAYSLYPGTAG